MTTIVGTIQEIVRQELRRLRTAELGVVEGLFPHAGAADDDNYGVDVRLRASGLLLRRVPVATGHIGTAAIPNVGDLVLLVFPGGDVNEPIVAGRLYNDQDRPPPNEAGELIFRSPLAEADERSIVTAVRNHQDRSPPREIKLALPPKITVDINDGRVRAVAGSTEMTLDQPDGSGGRVTVVAGSTTITVNQDGDISVQAAGSLSLEATGDVSIKGANVQLESRLRTTVTAQTQLGLTARMGATVDGGLSATVRGASVAVNGLTSFSPA
jgi:uncharacterized protein involved in type VI secretion and phage assembly